MPFLPPNQQRQSTESSRVNTRKDTDEKHGGMDECEYEPETADEQWAKSASSHEWESNVHPGIDETDAKRQRCTDDVHRSHRDNVAELYTQFYTTSCHTVAR